MRGKSGISTRSQNLHHKGVVARQIEPLIEPSNRETRRIRSAVRTEIRPAQRPCPGSGRQIHFPPGLNARSLATGKTRITGLLEAEDVLDTAKAVTALGAPAAKVGATWEVLGRGTGGLAEPREPLDFGNSGTGTRLMMGVLALTTSP